MNLKLALTLRRAWKVSEKQVGLQPQSPCLGSELERLEHRLPAGRAGMSFRADGNAAHAPPPAQLLSVLSSVRSDYLEAVHLLRACLSPFLHFFLGNVNREEVLSSFILSLRPSNCSITGEC